MPRKLDFRITDAKGGAAFSVRVVTRAASTEFAGVDEEGNLKMRLTAPSAGDDAANAELVSFLAERLGVDAARIEIVAGMKGRDKLVSVTGVSTADVEERLGSHDEA